MGKFDDTGEEKKGKKKKKAPPKNQAKADLEVRIRRRVALEEKAFRIVERLVDESVDEDQLKALGQQLEPRHYDDVTEERSIAGLCGYPVCATPLGKILSQKYKISTTSNRVYDITERKKFCSDRCYKASRHFGAQIASSPVWLREDEPPVRFELLPLDGSTRGSAGEEVVLSPTSREISRELRELDEIDQRNERSYRRLQQATKKLRNESEEKEHKETDVTSAEGALSDLKENATPLSIQVAPKDTKIGPAEGTISSLSSVQSDKESHPFVDGNSKTLLQVQHLDVDTIEPNQQQDFDREVRGKQPCHTSTSDNMERNRVFEFEYPKPDNARPTTYGFDHVDEVKKVERLKNELVDGLPSHNAPGDPTRESKPVTYGRDYGFDYQSRKHVYGFDHSQQILKMEANKELLLSEFQKSRCNCNSPCNCNFEPQKVENEENEKQTDYHSNASARDAVPLSRLRADDESKATMTPNGAKFTTGEQLANTVENKGNLLLQLLNKRDELRRRELNCNQNSSLEAKQTLPRDAHAQSRRRSGILQNVQRASEQKHVFAAGQSKSSISDSDDSDDVDDDDRDANSNVDVEPDIRPDPDCVRSRTDKTRCGPVNTGLETTCSEGTCTSGNGKPDDVSGAGEPHLQEEGNQASSKITSLVGVEDHTVKEQPVKDYSVKDQSVKDYSVQDQSVKDHSVKDQPVKDHCVKDQSVKDHSVTPKLSPLMVVRAILMEWRTAASASYLKFDSEPRVGPKFEERYSALGRRLDRKFAETSELLGEVDSDDDYDIPAGKLPDMRTLNQESMAYELRVSEYLGANQCKSDESEGLKVIEKESTRKGLETGLGKNVGQRTVEEDAKARRFRKKFFPMKEENEGRWNRDEFVTERDVLLPYVDSASQIGIRRRIVLDKLSKVLPDLLTPLRMTLGDVTPRMRELVHTFNLTSKNVTLKPAEWVLMCLLLLKLLANKIEGFDAAFSLHSARTYFDTLLQRIGVTEGQLSHVVGRFMR